MRNLIAPLGVLLILGCGDPTASRPDLTGDWFGTFQGNTGPTEVRWALADADPIVTGTGTFLFSGGSIASFEVGGSHRPPDVILTMEPGIGVGVSFYNGTTQGADSIAGSLLDVEGAHQLIMVRQ